jgi:RNA polymerase sigma factor (sigma-70 family)
MADKINPNEVDLNSFLEEERAKARCYLTKTYSVKEADADDIIQDSSIALFKNIKEGKLVKLTSTLSTYFLQICIYQTMNYKRKSGRLAQFTEAVETKQKDEYSSDKIDELLGFGESGITNEQKEMMRDIVQSLPKPCDDILWYFYGDDLDMKTIANLLDYSSADTVKTTKSRCMSKLKERFKKIKEDFYA